MDWFPHKANVVIGMMSVSGTEGDRKKGGLKQGCGEEEEASSV